jgi:hypothetical protein
MKGRQAHMPLRISIRTNRLLGCDRALRERPCDIEQIVAVTDSLDARTSAAGLEQLDRLAACQNCRSCCGRSGFGGQCG